ncbi:MAG: RNA polymerase sigma-70 factor [Gemmatimonadota bacterium]|jgi:RNA polymerase sigma-70 factor (ECF subfamily)
MEEHRPSPDSELLERVRGGDPAALQSLLDTHWARLVRYARRLLPEPEDAQDVVQDAFVRLWARRTRWKVEGSVRSLLFTITRNAALDEMRRRARRGRAAQAFRGPAPPALPSEEAAASELERAAAAAVAALPPRRQEVFRLVREAGLSYGEIAEVMDVSPQTVANQMSLALADLRRALRPHLPEGASR